MSPMGLYYHNTVSSLLDVALINTIAENMQMYTCHQIEGAYNSYESMKNSGGPSTKDL